MCEKYTIKLPKYKRKTNPYTRCTVQRIYRYDIVLVCVICWRNTRAIGMHDRQYFTMTFIDAIPENHNRCMYNSEKLFENNPMVYLVKIQANKKKFINLYCIAWLWCRNRALALNAMSQQFGLTSNSMGQLFSKMQNLLDIFLIEHGILDKDVELERSTGRILMAIKQMEKLFEI